jgi:hypothetical protein
MESKMFDSSNSSLLGGPIMLTLCPSDVLPGCNAGCSPKMLTYLFTYVMKRRISPQLFFTNSTIQHSTMASSLESVAEITENVTEVDVYGTSDARPVKAKKTTTDRLKTERASMHPTVLDPAFKRPRLHLAADPPLPPTPEPPPPPPPPPAGQNSLCTSTYPGENQHPLAWSGADQGGDWRPYDNLCEQPYDSGAHYNKLWRCKFFIRPAPLHDDRRWDDHAPLPYNYQSFSPYRSSRYVPPRGPAGDAFNGRHQASTSSSLNFQDFGAFQDAVQREIQRVSLSIR